MLKTIYEPKIYNLHENIISLGSFERDGSYPYVYNNEQAAIILEDVDSDFKCTPNNNITAYKTLKYRENTYIIPVLTTQIKYDVLDTIAKNNNAKISLLHVLQIYKSISNTIDSNGMLMMGFKYDQDPDKIYKFKTIGIRGTFGVKNTQYGVTLWAEALQYDQDDDGNTTITSLVKQEGNFYPYNYALEYLTIMNTFEYDSANDKLKLEYSSVEKQPTGDRLLDLYLELNTDSDNADFTPDKIDSVITMPELNQTIQYSYYHIKTFGDKLSFNVLEHQSNIIVAL